MPTRLQGPPFAQAPFSVSPWLAAATGASRKLRIPATACSKSSAASLSLLRRTDSLHCVCFAWLSLNSEVSASRIAVSSTVFLRWNVAWSAVDNTCPVKITFFVVKTARLFIPTGRNPGGQGGRTVLKNQFRDFEKILEAMAEQAAVFLSSSGIGSAGGTMSRLSSIVSFFSSRLMCTRFLVGLSSTLGGGIDRCQSRRHRIKYRIKSASAGKVSKSDLRRSSRSWMARSAGIEPATNCLEGSCSIRLSYERMNFVKTSCVDVLLSNVTSSIRLFYAPRR